MQEKELRSYWYPAFSAALRFLTHPETATPAAVAKMVRQCNGTVFNRLFCLAVWGEIRRQKNGTQFLASCQYKNVFADAWNIFRDASDPVPDSLYWDGLVESLGNFQKKYAWCGLVQDLSIYVILEEIERIYKEKTAVPEE